MEFSRPEKLVAFGYQSGWPFPSPGDFPNQGIEPRSPALQVDSWPAEPQGKPKNSGVGILYLLQWIFPTWESNWGLLHCRQNLYHWAIRLMDCSLRVIYFIPENIQFNSVSVMSNSLWPHGLQHARHPCPSPTPRVYTNSCPLSQWRPPTISSSVVPFFSCHQSFPVSGSFQMNQFFASGGQSIGVSTSASVLPMSIQGWFPLGWTSCMYLQSKGLSRVFSNTTVQKHQFFGAQLTSIHDYWKNHSFD